MGDDEFETVRVAVDDGVAVATIDAPPINVMTLALYRDLRTCADRLAADDDVRVVVLRSADPDFFIAHFDVEAIISIPTDAPAERSSELDGFHRMCEQYRTMPKPTIAEIAGRVGGGGSELALSCDMRFGAIGRTVVNQMEVPIGILPGGTGTQRLPRLVGRGRAMEIVLGGIDVDAATAERWGLLNRALPPDELTPYVDRLARRIASFPPGAVALAKQSVLNADDLPPREGLLEEAHLFQQTLRLPGTTERIREFLARGGQTREGELRVADLMDPGPEGS
jgi:enoyl-CoA hydratase/carnithine racemase